jgi:cytochrome oxidase Cu insertion factor (SCO1/SenC/PrrC family)
MLDKWRFLVGSEAELRPVWKSYWLDPIATLGGGAGEVDASHEEEEGAGVHPEGDPNPGGAYLVSHSAPVFLIDSRGYRRVLLTELSLEPERLVHDVRLLLR